MNATAKRPLSERVDPFKLPFRLRFRPLGLRGTSSLRIFRASCLALGVARCERCERGGGGTDVGLTVRFLRRSKKVWEDTRHVHAVLQMAKVCTCKSGKHEPNMDLFTRSPHNWSKLRWFNRFQCSQRPHELSKRPPQKNGSCGRAFPKTKAVDRGERQER